MLSCFKKYRYQPGLQDNLQYETQYMMLISRPIQEKRSLLWYLLEIKYLIRYLKVCTARIAKSCEIELLIIIFYVVL